MRFRVNLEWARQRLQQEVPQGMAPGLVLDTDRGTDPDVEDGKKKCRHESKCWTEIISSITIGS